MKSIRSLGLLVLILVMVFLLTTPIEGSAIWWDKFGVPRNGGTLVNRSDQLDSLTPDTGKPPGAMGKQNYYYECLFGTDWTLDRNIWPFTAMWAPAKYCKGHIAEGWEQKDPLTVTVTIRKGVHWHDKPPVNGREFTAEDVQYNYDRALGTGSGFDKPNPLWSRRLGLIESVKATGKYTVDFKFKNPSVWNVDLIMNTQLPMVAREWVEKGDLDNVSGGVGTSPWIVKDFVRGTSITFSRNPKYWGHDERHPENQLPYADELRDLAIADWATTLAAIRTGKISFLLDAIEGPSLAQVASLLNTHPEMQVFYLPSRAYCVSMRCDTKPFTDIRVRKALQLAVNVPEIAASIYMGKVEGVPSGLLNTALKGWGIAYDEWPEDLKEEYSYNPEKAKQLLAEAGYPDGFKTEVILQSSLGIEVPQIIKSYFMNVGVDMEIKAMDAMSFKQQMEAGKFNAMIYKPDIGVTSPKDGLYGLYQTSFNGELTNINRNSTYNNDSIYNGMFEKFENLTSMEEASELAIEMGLYALKQHWTVNTCAVVVPQICQPWVKGYMGEATTMGQSQFLFSRLWVDQDVKKSMGY